MVRSPGVCGWLPQLQNPRRNQYKPVTGLSIRKYWYKVYNTCFYSLCQVFFIFYFYFNFLDYLQFFQILTTVSSHLWFILESTKKNKTTLTTTVTINFFSFFHKRRVNRNSSPCPPFWIYRRIPQTRFFFILYFVFFLINFLFEFIYNLLHAPLFKRRADSCCF